MQNNWPVVSGCLMEPNFLILQSIDLMQKSDRCSRVLITARKRSLRRLIFSQVSVCPQGGLSLCPGGVSVQGGLCLGVSVQGGLCPGGGLCLGGISVQGESLSSGSLSSRGVLCHGDPLYGSQRRYASY